MAEFKFSRLRYKWKGNWNTSIDYNRDDVIHYRGKSWICIRQHTSTDFAADVNFKFPGDTNTSPAWLLMAEGYEWRGDWTATTLYQPGNLVLFGGTIFLCVISHTGTVFEDDETNWTVYSQSDRYRGNWNDNTTYGLSDVVRNNGIVYRCISTHTSQATLEDDLNKWEVVYDGIVYRGVFEENTYYVTNDLVKFGPTIFRCITPHSSNASFADENFQIEFFGSTHADDWQLDVAYGIGDIVLHGGYLYIAVQNSAGEIPDSNEGITNPSWAVLSESQRYQGIWNVDTEYKAGDIVTRGGIVYKAKVNSFDDGSTQDYLADDYWEVVIPGNNWRNFWHTESQYFVGDIVSYEGNAYRCNFTHFSSNENYPGDNGNGFDFWNLILQGSDNTALSKEGDLLSFGLSRSRTGDTSTLGASPIPIGNPGEILTVSTNDDFEYKKIGQSERFFYVTLDGIDDDLDAERGISPFKPWRTVEFACEQANDNYPGLTTINIGPGLYEEVLPIVVPKRTAIKGTELRTTTITVNSPIEDLDITQFVRKHHLCIDRISDLMESLLVDRDVEKTETNPIDPVYSVQRNLTFDGTGNPVTDQEGNLIFETIDLASDSATTDDIVELLADIKTYVNFNGLGTGSNVVVDGSNSSVNTEVVNNAIININDNVNFLIQEAIAFVELTNIFSSQEISLLEQTIKRYLNAFTKDLRSPGNYHTVKAAKYQTNLLIGSAGTDMFYVRDSSGIRNLSLEGLRGDLNPSGVFELFQRPTGGSYVSLDPGWGPNHEDCWIMNRSCYVQNVTTFGYGAVGQKIDGALHNGGNKSIVSNDFTQVISDGIGAWVLNNGRAELVSVFTYYAQVGYLAEDGGVIRATNGNCSYGNFGAYATGFDATEVYSTGFVNNRAQDAIIDKAFAGEVNDEILALEYINAGIGYSQAQASFLGAGVNVDVEYDDFRDNAIFRYEITNPLDSGVPGGGGYTQNQNNAQTGDEFTITIASSDESLESELLGLRILITSGTGTGQYGYVQAYNDITKVVTVYRESDNQPGWDHIVSGTPPVLLMDTSTLYKFEARPVIADPGFTSESVDLTVNTNWGAVAFGPTTEQFTNVIASLGSGTVVTDDGLEKTGASFDVDKIGTDYSVSLRNGGAGYAVNDTIIISGSDLGGISPDNDIEIIVSSVSDDSTNAIVTFSASGNGTTGRFVITSSVGNTVAYSSNGDDWEISLLPFNGNWSILQSGENKFLALRPDEDPNNVGAVSSDGINWTSFSLPTIELWRDIVYGNGIWLAVASSNNRGAFSVDGGETWSSTTLPEAPDSSLNQWVSVTYGRGKFVAISNSNNVAAVGTYNTQTGTFSWELEILDVISDSSQKDWISVEWGNNRFVALSSQGDIAYSFTGDLWLSATMPTPDGSTQMTWTNLYYDQGIFFAICNTGGRTVGGDETTGPTNYCATSKDGIVWTNRFMESEANWVDLAYGGVDITVGDSSIQNRTPTWIVITDDQTASAEKVFTGAKAEARVEVLSGRLIKVNIWDPGSGYRSMPDIDFVDPNNTSDVFVTPRIGDGVLAQPSWLERGQGFRTSSTTVTITGDGVADVIPINNQLFVDGLTTSLGPGSQLLIEGLTEPRTVVLITELPPNADGTLRARVQVDPGFTTEINPEHLAPIRVRERYSACRITGHDFLDIGTGNFVETNYPDIYASGEFFVFAPENEVTETDGGRVFYTSTDQDGNFRAGELFAVEQATGVVTISAEFFDLDGLSELQLGGIRVGGSGVVIREFSTDPLFTEDSNNVIPTQRAIAAYLQNQLSVGGSELTLSNFIAGTTSVGPDNIRSSVGNYVRFPEPLNFQADINELDEEGNIIEDQGQVKGTILAHTLFKASFNDDPDRQT